MSASYDENAIKSPLLALPPEVRNRIFEYVLGCGETVHIWISPLDTALSVRHSICNADIDEESAARTIKCLDDATSPHGFAHRHATCQTYTSHSQGSDSLHAAVLSVNFLATCRQVHRETALLAFEKNTFAFKDDHALRHFLNTIIPAQAHAVRSVVLLVNGDADASQTTAALYENKLRNLKRLVVFREITAFRDALVFTRFSGMGTLDWQEPLLTLAWLSIPQITIAAYNRFSRRFRVDKAVLEKWAADMEQRLMANPDGLTYTERIGKRKRDEHESELERRKLRRAADGRLRQLNS